MKNFGHFNFLINKRFKKSSDKLTPKSVRIGSACFLVPGNLPLVEVFSIYLYLNVALVDVACCITFIENKLLKVY